MLIYAFHAHESNIDIWDRMAPLASSGLLKLLDISLNLYLCPTF
jgi:hypothetical protein